MSVARDLRADMLAALAWQAELGADEAIAETPVDRFALETAQQTARATQRPAPTRPAAPALRAIHSAQPDAAQPDAVRAAREIAAGCRDLASLGAALAAFDGCPLKQGARNCVFADGDPAARVMIVGEAPGRDEDIAGKPFVGRSGQLLDRMLAAIGLDRRATDPARGVYITNILPWRPVENRAPSADETAMLTPFVARHIALADPEFVLVMGATAARALLQTPEGILKLRGRWRRAVAGGEAEDAGRLCLPTLHPAYLLRNPAAKRLAWRDLLSLRAALDGEPPQAE